MSSAATQQIKEKPVRIYPRVETACCICTRPFQADAYIAKKKPDGVCCSPACSAERCWQLRGRKTVQERTWAKIDKTPGQGPKGNCWEFRGARRPAGYGEIGTFKDGVQKILVASRVILEEKLGRPLQERMQACHTCDWPPCCRPDHLFEGTPKENTNDAQRKGRMPIAAPDLRPIVKRIKLTLDQGGVLRDIRRRSDMNIYEAAYWMGMTYSAYFRFERGAYGAFLKGFTVLLSKLNIPINTLGIFKNQITEGRGGKKHGCSAKHNSDKSFPNKTKLRLGLINEIPPRPDIGKKHKRRAPVAA